MLPSAWTAASGVVSVRDSQTVAALLQDRMCLVV